MTGNNGSLCPAGQYQSANFTEPSSCELCPVGTFSGLLGGTSLVACNGTCVSSPGSYCASGAVQAVGALCPAGQYSDAVAQSICSVCPAGTFGSTSGRPTAACSGKCPAGQYSSAGSTFCLACPPGRYTSVTGSTTSTACLISVIPPGFASLVPRNSSNGSPCPPGQYSSAANLTDCSLCPSGAFEQKHYRSF